VKSKCLKFMKAALLLKISYRKYSGYGSAIGKKEEKHPQHGSCRRMSNRAKLSRLWAQVLKRIQESCAGRLPEALSAL